MMLTLVSAGYFALFAASVGINLLVLRQVWAIRKEVGEIKTVLDIGQRVAHMRFEQGPR